ncbi:M1 family metallopeptidase [Sphingomonas sanxanigenens]|uniref:Aminopeptidase n=1 Tax=Sphingomonas sanxanigenens DSM 19645 = NX02 TaxID=1123269 RepID=W0AIW9_9SPHN|nr:M1 family metallopeptidase [Sphingomonas sanxanigenens]AHE56482.1 hypothetical protein NX02_24375 [Sphingomonas sanxanigenens DSM 19645 = NX02]
MRVFVAALLSLLIAVPAVAQDVPIGKLPSGTTPTAYRLDLTVDPEQERFTGHAEIDVTLDKDTPGLFLHGRGLKVTRAFARVGNRTVAATYKEVNTTLGVVRLDFASALPAGKAVLLFDYDAPFGEGPAGLYRVKVGDIHYAWTQFQSIDARAAFPGFDEPGFKTPFTVSLTTPANLVAVSNGEETGTTRQGRLVRHRYATTEKLPTYLVAFAVGQFDVVSGQVPPTPQRAKPLPLRILATKGQGPKLDYALKETPRIVELLEHYFDSPFPFSKLDQIASPVMGGAMENAGAVIYDDSLLVLGGDAPVRRKQGFGMVVAHELAHQWFGDLVTPAWWDDIWLNESFANWMGYFIADKWRPELNIQVGAIEEALAAMNTDALAVGRPIRQPITDSGEIDSAFDAITYGKGGQVVDMIANYMGEDAFRKGVHIHMKRYARGNATGEDFFRSLSEGAGDPRLVQAMRGFVEQQGVPVVAVRPSGESASVSQKRYAALGAEGVPATQWTIPFCATRGDTKSCTLVDKPAMTAAARGSGPVMPNAGGRGYYRFDLPEAEWTALIARGPHLPAGEALAATDSLWASFRAGGASPAQLVQAAKTLAAHSDSNVAIDGGERLSDLRARGLISGDALKAYPALMASIYVPRLKEIGFDPRRGSQSGDDPDRQAYRNALVALAADDARDPATRAALEKAAKAFMAGDDAALDASFLRTALRVHVEEGGLAAAQALYARATASQDAVFRSAALGAVAASGNVDTARWLLGKVDDAALRSTERVAIVGAMAGPATTQPLALDWLKTNLDRLVKDSNLTTIGQVMSIPGRLCSVEDADTVRTLLQPKVKAVGRGQLTLDRAVERVRACGQLKAARGAEINAAILAR